MATSDSPTREEIYWGVCYRTYLCLSAPFYSDDDREQDDIARRHADAALRYAKKHGFPKGF